MAWTDGPRIRKVILGTSTSNQGTWTGLPDGAIGGLGHGSPSRSSPFTGQLHGSGASSIPFSGSQSGTGVGHLHGSGASSFPFSGSQSGTGVGHLHGSGASSFPFSGSQSGTGVGPPTWEWSQQFPLSAEPRQEQVWVTYMGVGSSPFGSSIQTGRCRNFTGVNWEPPFSGGSQTGTGVGHLTGVEREPAFQWWKPNWNRCRSPSWEWNWKPPFSGGSQTGTGVGPLQGSGTGNLPFNGGKPNWHGCSHLHGSGTGSLPFSGGSQTGTGVGHLHGSGTGSLPFSGNSSTSETIMLVMMTATNPFLTRAFASLTTMKSSQEATTGLNCGDLRAQGAPRGTELWLTGLWTRSGSVPTPGPK
ncbi:putative per-hexamer repeat protein 5 [Penaeus monodon]|uniref:putative per-hexamer repeat protein 5 n=1 Tax=Penaeus monodon TaxID=6687 RepID=UPI0018A7B504|nr:putative per-hexamer repeat protein 5 [Penaeus monodon]